ncbi:ImpB/MucB/SamB family protein [Histomonas meleagridis]|uniref:ImpB/MucB/SamB family protein n=1 Tax=Histomonas meleagridis TaxID=135588 RepID=UPI00355AC72E|nr:ImpB/MucB/SamB family protein [Histomonas meleagridis]KAH0800885.1 ImpB/MucB/SamB family protein [Histomonas meleagridis]
MTNVPADGLLYNQVKAGLQDINPHTISKKITEVSKNTKYFERQSERSKVIDDMNEEMSKKLREADANDLHLAKLQVDSYIEKLEKKLSFDRIYFHADLDAFFASVEEVDDPSLVGKAFVVGGSIRHGVVSTSSYEARKYGIRSGMAIFIALSLFPDLIIVDHHGDRYVEMSKQVQAIFAKYDLDYVSGGLDEASLDVTEYIKNQNISPENLAKTIQAEVFQNTKLTISIGIAHTRQLAKIGSDINKPNGIFSVPRNADELKSFMNSLKIRKIPGIGGVTERKLQSLNINTVKDVFDKKAEVWFLFSRKFREFLFHAVVGVPFERIKNDKRKSYSTEGTFDATDDIVKLMDYVEPMCQKISNKMQRENLLFKTITVKFKSADFKNFTKAVTLNQFTNKYSDLSAAALKILMDEHKTQHMKLRLIGVKVNNFLYPGEMRQMTLMECDTTPKPLQPKPNKENENEEEYEMEPPVIEEKEKKKKVNKEKIDYFLSDEYLDALKNNENVKMKPTPVMPNGTKSKSEKKKRKTYSIKSFFSSENDKSDDDIHRAQE